MNWFLKVLKQYADFNGRARRKEYWMFILFFFIIYIVLGVIAGIMPKVGLALIGIFYLGMIVPIIAVSCRRMHDVGKSGWYQLIPIYSFILAVTEGDKGDNEYGSDPKNPGNEIDQMGIKTDD